MAVSLSIEERERIKKRFDQMDNDASPFRARWKDIQTYLCPSRGYFDDALPTQITNIDQQIILNSTPSLAHRTLAAALSSGMTPSSRPWFKLGLTDTDLQKFRPARIWLEDFESRMYAVMGKSNMHGCLDIENEEIPAFGIGGLFVEEDYKNVIRCRAFTAGEYFIGLGADGRVETFGHKIWRKVGDVAKEFGMESLSMSALRMYQDAKQRDQYIKLCHLIEPNDDAKYGMLDSSNMRFRSIWWEDGKINESLLRVSGYRTFPAMFPRWKTRDSMAIYGISPAWECLGDIKMIQSMESKLLLGIDKLVDPPMLVHDKVDGEPTFLPGERIKYDGQIDNPVRSAYEGKLDVSALSEKMGIDAIRIDRVFFRDLLQMASTIEKSGVTAYQIQKMYEEKLMVLGPVLENFKVELHDPLIDRIADVMINAGIVPRPPDELRGMELKVEYTSVLAQAQKMVGTAAIIEWYGFHERVCALYPDAADTVDPDKVIRAVHGKQGCPEELLRDENEVAAIRQQKAQQQAQQAQAAQAAQGIEGAQKLANTPVGNSTALDTLMKNAGASVPAGVA